MTTYADIKNSVLARMPLVYVFLSGIGFSIQTLMIKLLKERWGFQGSFQCVFMRGWTQLVLSVIFIYYGTDCVPGKSTSLFGDTNYVRWIMFLRSFIGYGGIAFSFLAVELIPIGDSTVLVMLSPLVASVGGYVILGEPWRIPEFVATFVSLVGAVLVAKPSFLFGDSSSSGSGGDGDTDNSVSDTTTGVIYSLIAALSAGLAYVTVRMLGTVAKMPWPNVCFAQSLCQIFLSIPSLYLAGQHLSLDLGLVEYVLIFLTGFVGAWSQIAMTVGMQREKSALATGMRMSDVVFGFIWQALFTADHVTLLSVLGAVLVTMSIVILVVFKQQTVEPANTKSSSSEVEGGDVEMMGITSGVDNDGSNPLHDLSSHSVGGSEQDEVARLRSQFMKVSGHSLAGSNSSSGSGANGHYSAAAAAGGGGARSSISRLITATLRRGSSAAAGTASASTASSSSSNGGVGVVYSTLQQSEEGGEEQQD